MVVKYKAKFANGVISLFEDYEDNQVGCIFVYSNFITFSLSSIGMFVAQDCLWVHHWFVLQFLHPAFKIPDKEKAYKAKFIHPNHKNFVQVISPENRYRLVGCTIPRVYVVREELPLHQLEWRGCKVEDNGNKEEK